MQVLNALKGLKLKKIHFIHQTPDIVSIHGLD